MDLEFWTIHVILRNFAILAEFVLLESLMQNI